MRELRLDANDGSIEAYSQYDRESGRRSAPLERVARLEMTGRRGALPMQHLHSEQRPRLVRLGAHLTLSGGATHTQLPLLLDFQGQEQSGIPRPNQCHAHVRLTVRRQRARQICSLDSCM